MTKSLLRSTSLVSCNTFLSRIMGFVRDIVFAHFFGSMAGFDAFIVAFRIPNFMRRLFAEGAFSQAFVPVLSQYRETKSPADAKKFISHMAGVLTFSLVIITVLGILGSTVITAIFAPGFLSNGVRFALTSTMLKITFPYLMLISLTALCSAVLNSYDSFGIPAITPVLLNIVLILMAIFATPFFPTKVYALAWGVFIAGFVQLLFQLPFLYKKELLPLPVICFKDPGVRRVMKLMVPALFGVSVAQIGILIDTSFASFLKVGSVSWLYYSDRLTNFPLGVFGVAIATVILPKLSRQHSNKDLQAYSDTMDWSLRLLLLIGIPAGVSIMMLAGPLLSTLFFGGKFDVTDVIMARKSLMAFGVGIQAFMLVKVLTSGFYARQDIKTPVKIAVVAVLSNIIFNFIFIVPLAHAGLALATSLASFINTGLLLYVLLKRKLYIPKQGWLKYFLQLIIANGAMGVFIYLFSAPLNAWLQHGFFWRVYHLAFLVIVGMILYLLSLFTVGLRIRHFRI